jgi:hypothetical protein
MAIMRTRALPTRVLAVWCPPSIGPLRTGAGHQATESLKASDHSGDAFLNRFIVEKLVLSVFKIESQICTWFCSLNQAASGFKQTTRIEFTQSTRIEFILFAPILILLMPPNLTPALGLLQSGNSKLELILPLQCRPLALDDARSARPLLWMPMPSGPPKTGGTK